MKDETRMRLWLRVWRLLVVCRLEGIYYWTCCAGTKYIRKGTWQHCVLPHWHKGQCLSRTGFFGYPDVQASGFRFDPDELAGEVQ